MLKKLISAVVCYKKSLLVLFLILLFWILLPEQVNYALAFLHSEYMTIKIGSTSISAYFILKSLIVMGVSLWGAGILITFGQRRINDVSGVSNSNKMLLSKLFQVLIYAIIGVLSLDILGIDLKVLTIFGGAFGIGVGLGLQRIVANFVSGIILLLEKSLNKGDLVELSDGIMGNIVTIRARYTIIEGFDGKEIIVPNEQFVTGKVNNFTFSDSKLRGTMYIGVSYDSDLDKAKQIILEALREHTEILANPAPDCYLKEFADISVRFLVRFWISDANDWYHQVQDDLMFRIWNEFKKHNITIPLPQREIYIKGQQSN